MTYNTGNPVPSIDPRDLDDNAQAFDRFLQSTAATALDRLGVARKTWHQMEVDAAALVSPNVAAFASLTGAANRLPYFTGAGALSLATITAFARTLLDDADAAAMQTTLGLVPTTSTSDTTVGRLLRVGDFGVGQLQLETAADANTVAATGLSRLTSSSLNGPSGVTVGVLLNTQQTASVGQQMVIATTGIYTRSQTAASTYTAWVGPLQVSAAALTALAALTPAADNFPYWTSATAAANASLTPGQRAALALTPAANQIVRYTSATAAVMQSFTTGAQSLAALTYAADRIGYTTSASAAAVTPLTAFGRSLIDDADAATARATLGALAQTDKPAWTAYTPTVTASSGTYTTAAATGKYVTIAGICYVQITLTVTTKGTGVTPIVTLPATALSGSTQMPLQAREGAINGKTGAAVISAALNSLQIFDYANGDLVTANGCVVYINGSYPVA